MVVIVKGDMMSSEQDGRSRSGADIAMGGDRERRSKSGGGGDGNR